ncbi:MAG: efflux RND transporter periplasmic adaptor subunit [Pirellulaceae bacterium]
MARKQLQQLGIVTCALVAAAAGAVFLYSGSLNSHAQGPKDKAGGAPPAPKVLVAPAQVAEVAEQRSFVGTVQPVRRSIVGSAAPGRVEEYLINEGDAVEAGQPIAQLRRGIIQAELNAAQGNLAVRAAELGELQASLQDEIEQATARVDNAAAQVAYRQGKVERSKALGSSIARELLEEDASLAAQADALLRESRAALRLLTEGARDQRVLQAKAQVEAQAAEVERLAEQFERHTLFAPFDGFVTAEHTEVGQWVMQGDPIAEIVELKQVDIVIAVLEDYATRLEPSVAATVEIPSLPGQSFAGRIALINPQADARARTFPVKVRVDNPLEGGRPLLKAGMFARVSLAVGQPVSRTLVPKDAIVLGGPSPVVFVVDTAQGKSLVRPVPVTLGPATGAWIAVAGEVQGGDAIIVEGNERVRPGQEVRIEVKEMKLP